MDNIFDFAKATIHDYLDYSRSFSLIKSQDIRNRLETYYDGGQTQAEGEFCPEPLIQINPHYVTETTVPKLVSDGLLHPKCMDIFKLSSSPMKLYSHQSTAISVARDNRDYVVTTGTGSGKSLSFFIPIVDRILKEKETDHTPRTRAVIIYPMNALANSQFTELEKFSRNSSGAFTFSIYTGQENESLRRKVAENPPDILLTNFMMMELLLTRHNENDSRVIDHCTGLEFLVLDELHTYRGRQGADVAMLIRRLRERLGTKKLVCIGTSATMSNIGTAEHRDSSVAEVAQLLFGSNARPQIITERLQRVTNPALSIDDVQSKLPAEIERYAEGKAALKSIEEFRNDPLAVWTELTLGIDNSGEPKRAKPVTLSKAAEKLVKYLPEIPIEEARTALSNFLIATYCLTDEGGARPFAFKLHQFIGAPGKLYTSLEPEGKRVITLMAQNFAPGRVEEGIRLYPTYFCRDCGREYMPVWYLKEKDCYVPRDIDDSLNTDEAEIESGFLTPVDDHENKKTPGDIPDVVPAFWLDPGAESVPLVLKAIKRDYRKKIPRLVLVAPNGKNGGADAGRYWFIRGKFRYCTDCGVEAEARGRDINRLAGLTGEGRSSATTMISLSLLRKLYKSPPREGEKETRKILGFIDNRQDAALQSGHFNDFIFLLTLRTAILEAVRKQGGKTELTDLPVLMAEALHFNGEEPSSEREYMKQPAISSLVRSKALMALREVLGFRALRDIRRGWRFNNPNLEKLQLLKIDFMDINGFASCEQAFKQSSELRKLSPQSRERLASLILTDLAQSMCINSRYFRIEEQEKIRNAAQSQLREPWAFDDDDFYQARRLQIGTKKVAKDPGIISCGSASRFLKQLKRKMLESGDIELVNLYNSLDSSGWQALISAFCDAAAEYGLMTKTPGNETAFYQIKDTVLLWHLVEDHDKTKVNQYFYDLYRELAADMNNGKMDVFRLESREHTAQIGADERKTIEKQFRYDENDRIELQTLFTSMPKRLPLLYCSPTMELGVDIASLNVVYMRNVPPTPANYAQRSGRAGRSGQPALVVCYCAAQSPHDRWFFNHKEEMVQGQVSPPNIDLLNEELVISHLHAIWLGEINYDIPSKISEVLDIQNPAMPLSSELQSAICDSAANERATALAVTHLRMIKAKGERPEWLTDGFARQVTAEAPRRFDEAFNRWRALYNSTQEQIRRANEITGAQGGDQGKKKDAQRRSAEALKQQRVLEGTGGEINSDFNTYRYLANQGFLPGYNFPRLPLMAWIPGADAEDINGRMLTRQRFLAISEFGPRSLIYHRGKTFRVIRAKIEKATGQISAAEQLPVETIKICEKCGCGVIESTGTQGMTTNLCPNCGAKLADSGRIENLYRIEAVETQPVERISINDEERQRQGFEIQTTYQFLPGRKGIAKTVKTLTALDGRELLDLTYSPSARIWKINKGWRRRQKDSGNGFWINPMSGYWVKDNSSDRDDDKKTQEDEAATKYPQQRVVPYVEDRRNVMILTPKDTFETEDMATILAALCRSIETIFEIEESELGAESLPDRTDRKTILLYEASEGGAGVLSRIIAEPQILRTVAQKALEIMHYNYNDGDSPQKLLDEYGARLKEGVALCETGCYNCLLSYYNQPDHEFIDRRRPTVLKFLTELAQSTEKQREQEETPDGALAEWLCELDRLGLRHPDKLRINKAGITADALYQDKCTLVILGKAEDSVRKSAELMGYSVLEFADKRVWAQVFEEYRQIFEKRGG